MLCCAGRYYILYSPRLRILCSITFSFILGCAVLLLGQKKILPGESAVLGGFVIKLQPNEHTSNQNELDVCRAGFTQLATPLWYTCTMIQNDQVWNVQVSKRTAVLSDVFRNCCEGTLTPDKIITICKWLKQVIQLFLDTTRMKFTFKDADAHNLGKWQCLRLGLHKYFGIDYPLRHHLLLLVFTLFLSFHTS